MEIRYCCEEAKSTAYLRYGNRVTRVTHQNVYIDGVGTCVAEGTTTLPDNKTVSAKSSRRFFSTNNGVLRKHYFCQSHITVTGLAGYFKTKAEALAALVTIRLCEQ